MNIKGNDKFKMKKFIIACFILLYITSINASDIVSESIVYCQYTINNKYIIDSDSEFILMIFDDKDYKYPDKRFSKHDEFRCQKGNILYSKIKKFNYLNEVKIYYHGRVRSMYIMQVEINGELYEAYYFNNMTSKGV